MSLEPRPLTLSGLLYDHVVLTDGRARFRLEYVPDGDDQEHTAEQYEVDEAVLPCLVDDPVQAAALAGLTPGTMLHLTGYLALPGIDGAPLRLVVLTVESTPRPAQQFTVAQSTERHGDYLAVELRTESGTRWELLHTSGAFAGTVAFAEQIPTAIEAHRATRGATEP